MFTILNIMNYFTGKYIPLIGIILITIGIYYYIINSYSDDIFTNNYYIIILLILMLLDITSLIVIFMYGDFLNCDLDNKIIIIKDKKDKKNKKDKKDKKDKKVKKVKKPLIENNINNKIIDNNKVDKNNEIISLYDNEKPGSIHTFVNFNK